VKKDASFDSCAAALPDADGGAAGSVAGRRDLYVFAVGYRGLSRSFTAAGGGHYAESGLVGRGDGAPGNRAGGNGAIGDTGFGVHAFDQRFRIERRETL